MNDEGMCYVGRKECGCVVFVTSDIPAMGVGAWLLGTARHFDEKAGGTLVMIVGIGLVLFGFVMFAVGTL